MGLDSDLREILRQAIQDYDFPCVTFDFRNAREVIHASMRDVESEIQNGLLTNEAESVKDSLSNVLYWGYARTGYRWVRVNRFRANVTEPQLLHAGRLFRHIEEPGVQQIARLELPEFSGLSFVSKTRMFLDPTKYVVLDRQLLKLREQERRNIFHDVAIAAKETRIRVSETNAKVYERWSNLCRRIAAEYFGDAGIRAVEIERGIFYLVQTKQTRVASEILLAA
jgi:hypothetical protein